MSSFGKRDVTCPQEQYLENLNLAEGDVERAIMRLNSKKSTGYDRIAISVVKGNAKFFSRILTPLYNRSRN